MVHHINRPIVRGFINIPGHFWAVIILMCVMALPTANAVMTIASILILPVFAMLTWRKSEPAILFFALFTQWTSIAVKIFYANSLGVTAEELSGYPQIDNAIWYALAGLGCMALGMRVGINRFSPPEFEKVQQEIYDLSSTRVFIAFCVSFIAVILFPSVGFGGGVQQLIFAMTQVQWLFFVLLAYSVIRTKKNRIYLIVALLAETILGFAGFFSDFKKPFMFLFIVFLSLGYRLRLQSILKASFVAVITISLGLFWTAVKSDYRDYLNQGTGQQVSLVSFKDKMLKLSQLFAGLEFEDIQDSVGDLAQRVAYVDYFAKVLINVPDVIPHEDGKLLKGAVMHILMPRLFFPGKPIIDDAAVTAKYTGESFEEHTSVSLGYMAHLYIDYGVAGMFVAIFFIGIGFGLMYQLVMGMSKTRLMGYAASMVVLLSVSGFGDDLSKLFGGSVTLLIAMVLFLKAGWPLIAAWCMPGSKKKRKFQLK